MSVSGIAENSANRRYKRVCLKLSGEALMGDKAFGIDLETVERIAAEIKAAKEAGHEISLVVGGGNIFRGLEMAGRGVERASADYMGMLATVMNSLAMQNALERIGVETRVMSAIEMTAVCEPYIRRRALHHLDKGLVVIFAAGSGNPFFTTDTAAALRAAEMGCDVLMKGTQVDGVYSEDPKKNPDAERFDALTYMDMFRRDIRVMDQAAISLTRENEIPILVFSLKDGLNAVLEGKAPHTLVSIDAPAI